MHVSALYLYPVKSLRGVSVPAATLDVMGIVGDRRFLIVDPSGRLLTQRVLPKMAQIAAQLDEQWLTLTASGAGSIVVRRPPDDDAPLRTVSVWKSEGLLAEDCGADAAAWLSGFLGTSCHLVRIGKAYHRPVMKNAGGPGDVVAFNDSVPLLALSEASLAGLNDRLVAQGEEPVPMNRFRPNIVIAQAPAFVEDAWPRVRVGSVIMRAAGPCIRCIVTTTDQLTGERSAEPLRTLATYRRDPNDATAVNFGQNFIHETKSGTIRVGDVVAPA